MDHQSSCARRYRLVALTHVPPTDEFTLAAEILSASLAAWEGSPDQLAALLTGIGARLIAPADTSALSSIASASDPAVAVLWGDQAYDMHLEPLP